MADSEQQIGFEQIGIVNIFRSYRLQVPLNQREYSWTDREVENLFFDISNAISEGAPEYFLGSIVAIPRKPTVLEIVDGQQRLATTAILVSAIRDYLKGRPEDKIIVQDLDSILASVDREARQQVWRLRLNVTDNQFFQQRILQSDVDASAKVSSHRLIDRAAVLAQKHVVNILKPHDVKNHGDVLNRWLDYLEHNAILVLLKVPSEVNAYRMFETLNDRGLRTSQSDLVKNYLFGQSGEERLAEAQQKWSSMRATLESIADEDITVTFLRQMLISLYGYLREPQVYETVQHRARGVMPAVQFLTALESGASDYAAILNPEHQKWNTYPPTSRRAIQTLALLGMRPMRPLMLSIARLFKPAEADRALRLLVNLSVRFLIVGGARSGTLENTIASTAQSISENTITTAPELLKSLEKTAPKDAEFKAAFEIATVSQAALARYYMRSLEMAANEEPFPCYIPNDDQQVINLEHVLPQKPEGNWPQFTPEEADSYYRRIGNLALIQAKTNSDLRSASFEEKRKVFSQSPFKLTFQIANSNEWTTKEIAARQSNLADLAVKTWPLSMK